MHSLWTPVNVDMPIGKWASRSQTYPTRGPLKHYAFHSPKPQPERRSGGIRGRVKQHGMAFIKHLLHVSPTIHFTVEDTGPEKASDVPWVEQHRRREAGI